MGRGGRGMFGGRGGSPSPAPRAAAPPPPPPAAAAAPSRGPGLMGQMAATAGGVAVGSVVGHGLSQAIFGGGSSGQAAPAAAPAAAPQAAPAGGAYAQQEAQPQPCEGEMGQFVQCALNSSDVADCVGYLDMLKKCRDSVMAQYQ